MTTAPTARTAPTTNPCRESPSISAALLRLQRTAGNQALAAVAGPSPAVWLAVQRKRTTAREHEPEELFRQRSEAYEKCKAKGAGLWNALQVALSSATPRTSAAPASHAHYLTRYRTTVTSEAGYIVVRAFRKEDHSSQATPLYRNDFHPNGDVVAKANYGNEDRAWKKDGALHNSEILANQRFLAGSELSRTTQAGFPALTRIKRDTVQNDISISVAEIVHPPEDEEAAVTELQSLPGTEDFEALLGTPNGAVQAHLLCDHVAELRATIASISTLLAHQDADFSKRRLNYMTFAISPAAPVATTGASGSSSNGASSPPKNAKLHNLLFG